MPGIPLLKLKKLNLHHHFLFSTHKRNHKKVMTNLQPRFLGKWQLIPISSRGERTRGLKFEVQYLYFQWCTHGRGYTETGIFSQGTDWDHSCSCLLGVCTAMLPLTLEMIFSRVCAFKRNHPSGCKGISMQGLWAAPQHSNMKAENAPEPSSELMLSFSQTRASGNSVFLWNNWCKHTLAG